MATIGLETPIKANFSATIEPALGSGCCHHWIINNPGGPLSPGTCKLCGERREFNNSLPVREYHRRGDRQPEMAAPAKTPVPAYSEIPDIGDAA